MPPGLDVPPGLDMPPWLDDPLGLDMPPGLDDPLGLDMPPELDGLLGLGIPPGLGMPPLGGAGMPPLDDDDSVLHPATASTPNANTSNALRPAERRLENRFSFIVVYLSPQCTPIGLDRRIPIGVPSARRCALRHPRRSGLRQLSNDDNTRTRLDQHPPLRAFPGVTCRGRSAQVCDFVKNSYQTSADTVSGTAARKDRRACSAALAPRRSCGGSRARRHDPSRRASNPCGSSR